MSITSPAFDEWADAFSKLSAYRGLQAEREEGQPKTPIKNTLDKVVAHAGADLSSESLRKNVLYACYQAAQTKKTGRDPGDERRLLLNQGFMAFYKQRKTLESIAELLTSHPEATKVAVDHFNTWPSNRQEYHNHQKVDAVPGILIDALRRLVDFSTAYKSDPGMVTGDMFYDCAEGTFLFFNRKSNRNRAAGKPYSHNGLVQLGLIFHLTYLFRYFSSNSTQLKDAPKLRGDGELPVCGVMLTSGENSYAFVAHLLNAVEAVDTSTTAWTSENVEQKLTDLLYPKGADNGKSVTDPFSNLEFLGWPPEP